MTCSSMELVVSNAFSCLDETCSLDETLLLQWNLCYFDETLLFLWIFLLRWNFVFQPVWGILCLIMWAAWSDTVHEAFVRETLRWDVCGLHGVTLGLKHLFVYTPEPFWLFFRPRSLRGFWDPLARCWLCLSLVQVAWKASAGHLQSQRQGQGQGQGQALMTTACVSVCRNSPQTCGSYA